MVDKLFDISDDKASQSEINLDQFKFTFLDKVTGSGYEQKVSELAIHDKIAHRAARPNMQKHSAIVVELGDEFVGFVTFQRNHKESEFCFLQSAIWDEWRTPELYGLMVDIALAQNVDEYPAMVVCSPKSDLETPEMFEGHGFKRYLDKSGFVYMTCGGKIDGHDMTTEDFARLKELVQITQTNVWNSVSKEWLRGKKMWNERIDAAGEANSIQNPRYATREGCWMATGKNLASAVSGKDHNDGASVLDPMACEVILKLFMPEAGKRIYNPFGGGVQFGFVSGFEGYEYVASEIRQNQCDANNAICSGLPALWVKSDSSTYDPEGMFDLVFTCPPYYKVERYVDYDGEPPVGELNDMPSYEVFRETLFAGYRKAIEHLNDNCFFIVMCGDSRDSHGNYYGCEAETELFIKQEGLVLYNKIVYLEAAFTKNAQVKHTMNSRKFPKQEQKIIVGFKGNPNEIKNLYRPVGRL